MYYLIWTFSDNLAVIRTVTEKFEKKLKKEIEPKREQHQICIIDQPWG